MTGSATVLDMPPKKPSGQKKPDEKPETPEEKKPSGGKNVTPRTPVQFPDVWLRIARLRAGTAKQPTLWYLIGLIDSDARAAGLTDLPPLPWEKHDREADVGE